VSDVNLSGKTAGMLSVTEVGLGALLHAYRVPLTGHFLSLNQGLLLSIQSKRADSPFRFANWTSLSTAAVKSLSPVGKRLTPMLAISMQGFLFSIGVLALGKNFLGRWLGYSLLGLWAFLQPLAIYFLVFGESLKKVAEYFQEKLAPIVFVQLEDLLFVLCLVIGLKWTIITALSILIELREEKIFERYFKFLAKAPVPTSPPPKEKPLLSRTERWQLVFKDLAKPWFLLTLLMITVFLFATSQGWVTWIWLLLRPVVAAALVFYFIRFAPIDKLIEKLKSNKGPIGYSTAIALDSIRSWQPKGAQTDANSIPQGTKQI
jgi:hypothetical protein